MTYYKKALAMKTPGREGGARKKHKTQKQGKEKKALAN